MLVLECFGSLDWAPEKMLPHKEAPSLFWGRVLDVKLNTTLCGAHLCFKCVILSTVFPMQMLLDNTSLKCCIDTWLCTCAYSATSASM